MAQRHNRIHSATGTGMALAFAWSFVGGGPGGNQRNFDSPKHEYTRTLMDAAFAGVVETDLFFIISADRANNPLLGLEHLRTEPPN